MNEEGNWESRIVGDKGGKVEEHIGDVAIERKELDVSMDNYRGKELDVSMDNLSGI